jgi:hypothetical protein
MPEAITCTDPDVGSKPRGGLGFTAKSFLDVEWETDDV